MVLFSWLLVAALVVPGCTARYQSLARPPALSADPSLEAQTRLLQDAQAYHAQARYAAAVRLLERFISTYPGSPHLAEARWWLARSYEQLGDVGAALMHYRTLAAGATGVREDSYEVRAMRRLEELRRAGNRPGAAAAARTALMLSPARLPPLADLEPWMQGLVHAGVTTLVLEAVTGDGTTPPGVYFDTGTAPVHRDVFGLVLPMARRVGLAVFAEVPLHRMPWVDPRSDWISVVYDPGERRMRPSATVDLLNPAVQDKLVGLAADLAQSGIEGVLVRFSEEKGFFAECGEAARNGFAAAFAVEPEPAQLCSVTGRSLEAMPQEFWRWVGWKFQERLRLVERIREAMRQKNPRVVVALEVHSEAVVDPLRALIEYGEDLMSISQRGFDLVLARPAVSTGAALDGGSDESTAKGLSALARWMSERAFDPRRLWITNVVQVRDARTLGEGLPDPAHRALLPDGVNLLHRAESGGAVP
jgi:tetratricopeptide (TPR) repeat protein